ncbi:MAG: TIGR02678 family protein [Burkholderiaceae bacterium]
MSRTPNRARPSRSSRPPLGELQQAQQRDEMRRALRALLMQPLMDAGHDSFAVVRRQADRLRDWFWRETGWALHVDREGARLIKRPAALDDDSRGLADYTRRRYVLLCLVCAVLERAESQITLQVLGERLLQAAADPALREAAFDFSLGNAAERRDLVAVLRTLLDHGVLVRVAGDEAGYASDSGWAQSDALYDVQRRMLAGMLAAARGPSTWRVDEAPADTGSRLRSLAWEYEILSEQGRRDTLRHHLARRLLDDPVVYVESLDDEQRAYFANQRGVMAARLADACGLVAEHRAEGTALTDETGELTDVAMPAEGTEAHVTLLVAEFLAGRLRQDGAPEAPVYRGEEAPAFRREGLTTLAAVAAFIRDAADRYGRFWRKSARSPGAEIELAGIAVERLRRLQLVARHGDEIRPLPAIARFALGEPVMSKAAGTRDAQARSSEPR